MSMSRVFLMLVCVALLSLATSCTWISPEIYAGEPTPDRIELPVGFRPEGIAFGTGSTFYVGSLGCCGYEAPTLVGGAIYRGDLRTGEGAIFVKPRAGQMAVGMTVDPRTQYLYVAGGMAKNLLVYDLVTGELVSSFALHEATFPNDVVVTPDAVYITDSFSDKLYRLPLNEAGLYRRPQSEVGATPAHDVLAGFPLTGDYALGDMSYPFQANGIVASPDGHRLIIVNSNTGMLYRVDSTTGAALALDLGGQNVAYGDGLVLDGNLLYVVQNYAHKISAVELNEDWTAGAIVAEITNPAFAVPTTAVQMGDSLYVVNARYEESEPLAPDSPDIAYEVLRIDKVVR